MINLECSPCTAVGSTVIPHMTQYAFRHPRVDFPALEAGFVRSGRATFENSCIRASCLFGEDSIAYARSFA